MWLLGFSEVWELGRGCHPDCLKKEAFIFLRSRSLSAFRAPLSSVLQQLHHSMNLVPVKKNTFLFRLMIMQLNLQNILSLEGFQSSM